MSPHVAIVVKKYLVYFKMKKTVKPTFIVDLTKAETCEDIKFEFIRAKAKAGVKLDDEEIFFLVNLGATMAIEVIDECIEKLNAKTVHIKDDKLYNKLEGILKEAMEPKKPWYKRFWGWITKSFKKNK